MSFLAQQKHVQKTSPSLLPLLPESWKGVNDIMLRVGLLMTIFNLAFKPWLVGFCHLHPDAVLTGPLSAGLEELQSWEAPLTPSLRSVPLLPSICMVNSRALV